MTSFLSTVISNVVLAAALAAVALVVTRCWRNRHVAHALWVLVLAKLVTPPLWHVPVPVADLMDSGPRNVRQPNEPSPGEAPAASVSAASSAGVHEAETIDEPIRPATVESPAWGAGAAPNSAPRALETAATTGPTIHWSVLVAQLWLVSSVLCTLGVAARVVRFHRMARRGQPSDEPLTTRVAGLARRLRLRRLPDVRLLEARFSPMVWPLARRKMLLLPRRLVEELTPEQLDTVLAHELAHLVRRDDLVRLLETAVTCLFWWNPVVWYARRELHAAEEDCCDALVVCSLPESRQHYGAALLRAAEMITFGRSLPALASAVGQQRPLKRRIEMILHHPFRRSASWPARLILCVLSLAVLPLAATAMPPSTSPDARVTSTSSTQTQQRRAPAAAASDEEDSARAPESGTTTLSGRVADTAGDAIQAADVHISLTRDPDPGWSEPEQIREWQITTAADGRVDLDRVWNQDIGTDLWVTVDVAAPGFVDAHRTYSLKQLTAQSRGSARIAEIGLQRGIQVSGRTIGKDLTPVVGAAVHSGAKGWRGRVRYTDELGRFQLTVPASKPTELLIYSSDWAPRRISVPPGRSELGDIPLAPGTRVSVRVVSADDQPLAGQLVVIQSTQDLSSFYTPLRLVERTDADGFVKFPALAGEFAVSCPQWAGGFRRNMMARRPFVAVTPQIVAFDGVDEHRELTLRAGPPLRLSGAVLTPDGEPAPGVRVLVSAALGHFRRGMGATPLQWIRTDAAGRYALESIPVGLNHVSVNAFVSKWNGQAVIPWATHPVTGRKTYGIRFPSLDKSYDGLDFAMQLREAPERTGPEWEAYFALQQELDRGVIPKGTAAPRFIQLAEKHPDHEVSVHALGMVCSIFGSMAPGVPEIDAARDELLALVMGDFLDHPDLSIVVAHGAIRHCDNSVYPRFEQMLRTVLDRSPHRTVQGHACYHLADFLEARTWLKKLDEPARARMLEEAQQLKARVTRDFADVAHVAIKCPLSELAEGWSAYSALGKAAPEIVGPDAQGVEFRLSDYRGQVVMLSFSGNWCAPCRRLYPGKRELVEKYKHRPFALLGVNSDRELQTLKQSIEAGDITWRCWWDGDVSGPISTAYNVRDWPTTYILDKQGIVRSVLRREPSPADLDLLDSLLAVHAPE